MASDAQNLGLEFEGEMLVARVNLIAYRQIYSLEGWLRRICLAAWMARFGDRWTDSIDPKLRAILQARVRRNRQRLYLGAESQDDLMWQTTHAELLQMLVDEKVTRSIQSMTGTSAIFLQGKLQEIREIRNLLAHNRALSERTYIILSGLMAALDEAVDTFKSRVLYGQSDILDDDDGWIGARLSNSLRDNDWSRFQAFAAKEGEFLRYVCLPANFEGQRPWPDARLLLHAFRDHLTGIAAFCINKTGMEFSILAPLTLDPESQNILCDTFARNPNVWTDVSFESQDPRFICSPKIWFYENRSPFYLDPDLL